MQNGQGGHGSHAAEACQKLADPEIAPVEAVHPQALNHGPAQAVPGGVAQGDLAVIGPLGVQEVQQQKAAQIPQALIQEGGVVVFPLPRHGIVQAHAAEGLRCRAEGFPVEEVAPAAHHLTDEKAHHHQIQQGGQGTLFDFAVHHHAQESAQHRAVDGQAAVPDVEHGDGVGCVLAPTEGAVVGPGTGNREGGDPEDAVQNVVLGEPCPLASAAAVDACQQQAQGDHRAVQVDGQRAQGQGTDGIHLNSQQGERDGGIVRGIGIHLVSSLEMGSMTQRQARSGTTARARKASTSSFSMRL